MVKINNQVPPGNVGRSSGRPAPKKAEDKAVEGSASESTKVDLSEKGTAIAAARSAAQGVSDVDEVKVAELRAALARGDYQADLRIVAERLITEAALFGGKQR